MQKKLLAVAVLSAFAGGASAQSANVTLYGTAFAHFESAQATGADSSTAASLGGAAFTSSVRTTGAAANAGTGSVLGQGYTATPGDLSSRWRTTGSGSNFGLRGTEDLGNGLSAWFQYELSTAAALGSQGNAVTSIGGFQGATLRNSAIGLRSNTWGTLFTGAWDTPINTHYLNGNLVPRLGVINTYASQAGFFGALPILGGGSYSATSVITACSGIGVAAFIAGSGTACLNAAMQVDRRQTNTIQWWSPNWNGIEIRAHFSPTTEQWPASANNQAVIAAAGPNAPATIKPNIWGGSLGYSNGPLWVGVAYERKNDLLAAAVRTAGGITLGNNAGTAMSLKTDMSGSKDDAWRISGRYKFALGGGSQLGIGARWERLRYTMNYANAPVAGTSDLTGITSTKWNLSGSFETGAHSVELQYFKAKEIELASTSAVGATPTGGAGTGAKRITLGYNYSLSKRTNFQAHVSQTTNDNNARYVGGVFFNLGALSGADPRYYGIGMSHTF